MDEPENLFGVRSDCSPARRGHLFGEFDNALGRGGRVQPAVLHPVERGRKVSKVFPYNSRCSAVMPSPIRLRAAAVFAGPPVLILPATAKTTSMPKDFSSARYTAANASKAAFDAPEGPLKGSGKVAVQVLTCTIRPRASRKAGRKAFTTASAPNTFTSNSRRIAERASTSSGPGVKIPALLMRRLSPPSVLALTSRAQSFTAASSVMSQRLRVTAPPDACLRSAISSGDIAVPNTR